VVLAYFLKDKPNTRADEYTNCDSNTKTAGYTYSCNVGANNRVTNCDSNTKKSVFTSYPKKKKIRSLRGALHGFCPNIHSTTIWAEEAILYLSFKFAN
jgi:hypothetical protein